MTTDNFDIQLFSSLLVNLIINSSHLDNCVKAIQAKIYTSIELRKVVLSAFGRRPEHGSLSEQRALQATIQLCKEILELAMIIDEFGEFLYNQNIKKVIKFGELFSIYSRISNKLIGLLIRARRYDIVDFPGECLFQGRDDNVPILLSKSIADIRKMLNEKIADTTKALEESERFHDN